MSSFSKENIYQRNYPTNVAFKLVTFKLMWHDCGSFDTRNERTIKGHTILYTTVYLCIAALEHVCRLRLEVALTCLLLLLINVAIFSVISTAGSNNTTPTISPTTSPNTPSTGTTPSTSTTPSVFGASPTGSGSTTNIDNKAAVTTLHQKTLLFWSLTLTLLLSGPLFSRA